MKYRWPLIMLMVLTGCSEKKPDLSGNVAVKSKDFVAAFPKISPPLLIADTNITKVTDTITIGYKVLQQFFPDSSLKEIVVNDTNMTIHPVGKIEKEKETYLLVNFTNRAKVKRLAVFVTDKKNKFLASKELLSTDIEDEYTHAVSINREPTFLISREKMGKGNMEQYTRTGWIYSSAGFFMVVINDSNEDPKKLTIINPLDTLSQKNKYSGDYIQDKKNFISLRDSKKPNTYLFFIHFEKNEGTCTGELKGEMKMKEAGTAQYTGKGDPCIIDFTFTGNEIKLKEQGTCGNHRGIKCFFDDRFVKKRILRSKKK